MLTPHTQNHTSTFIPHTTYPLGLNADSRAHQRLLIFPLKKNLCDGSDVTSDSLLSGEKGGPLTPAPAL